MKDKIELIQDVKQNDWITLKQIQEPKPNQVWVRNHFDRSSKTYSITNWQTGKERFLKANRVVFTNFTF
tara:strand:+ start:336 stop:542 length:207 start_codon:yes stop_codon:yes gene_type:complete